MTIKTPAGKCGWDGPGDVHVRSRSVLNGNGNPPGADPRSYASGSERSNDKQPDTRRSNINGGGNGGGGIAPDGRENHRDARGAVPKRAKPRGDERADDRERHHAARTVKRRETRGSVNEIGEGNIRPPRQSKPSDAADQAAGAGTGA